MTSALDPDPPRNAQDRRPLLLQADGGWLVAGFRCSACTFATPDQDALACAKCGSEVQAAQFGPAGTVWSITEVLVSSRPSSYVLAFVDLTEGPRILAEVTDRAIGIGAGVELIGYTETGDPAVRAVSDPAKGEPDDGVRS